VGVASESPDELLRKWLALLPHPFTAADREAGYRLRCGRLAAARYGRSPSGPS
jgi:hypothetical protein